MFFRNFGQTHLRAAVSDNPRSIDAERRSAYSPAFQFRSAHSGPNSLDDQTFLELRNRTDYDYDRST